ncbi:MAG: pyridoxamine 5'-phosphate oxidase [Gammaproteobacteria bacterium]
MASSAGGSHPFELFKEWFELAESSEPSDVDAASIATVAPDGQPSLRVVLIRGISEAGFTFYTNLGSRKVKELEKNPRMALCFHWKSVAKQVRVEGLARQVNDAEADAYFAGRPRESQIGAWASRQSEKLRDRDELEERVRHFEAEYANREVVRPPFWSGFLLEPNLFEFWDKRPFRLHDRQCFVKKDNQWHKELLFP